MNQFFEELFFNPRWYHFPFVLSLLPLSILYGLLMAIRRIFAKAKDFNVPIVSIGNLVVGGSGKTPFAISLIEYLEKRGYEDIFYISRGYGRRSKGLVAVKTSREIKCSVEVSGDESMLVAEACNCSVIVAEDRAEAIENAKRLGAKIIILDDAFSKVSIKKFDILLEPARIKNYLPLPAGPFREFFFTRGVADLLAQEGKEYKRVVSFEGLEKRMLLLSAISNPKRLLPYLPEGVVGSYFLQDHAYFKKSDIIDKMEEYQADFLLVTQKDYVKLKDYNLPISVMKLQLDIDKKILERVEKYINGDF